LPGLRLEECLLLRGDQGRQSDKRDGAEELIEQDRFTTEIVNLEDSRDPLMAQLKVALGLKAEEAAPPVPAKLETTPLDLTGEKLFTTLLARNPRLKAIEAEVRHAERLVAFGLPGAHMAHLAPADSDTPGHAPNRPPRHDGSEDLRQRIARDCASACKSNRC
jgi:hypothetical protein